MLHCYWTCKVAKRKIWRRWDHLKYLESHDKKFVNWNNWNRRVRSVNTHIICWYRSPLSITSLQPSEVYHSLANLVIDQVSHHSSILLKVDKFDVARGSPALLGVEEIYQIVNEEAVKPTSLQLELDGLVRTSRSNFTSTLSTLCKIEGVGTLNWWRLESW